MAKKTKPPTALAVTLPPAAPVAPVAAIPPPPGAPAAPLVAPNVAAAPPVAAAPAAPVFVPPSPPVQAPAPAPRQEQNGVVKPSAGTGTGYVWDVADYITAQKGGVVATRAEVVTACAAQGQNASTATTQYGKWARYNGHVSAVVIPRGVPAAPQPPAPPVAPTIPRYFVARNGSLVSNEPLTTEVIFAMPDYATCNVMLEGTEIWTMGVSIPRPAPVPVAPPAPMPVAPAAVAVPVVDPAFQAGVDGFNQAMNGVAVTNPYTEYTEENTQFLAGWTDAAAKVAG